MKKEYINYTDLIKRKSFKGSLEEQGFIIIPKKRFKLLGYILIGFGIITLPLPCGSVLIIALGLSLLGLSSYKIKESIRKKIFKLKRCFI